MDWYLGDTLSRPKPHLPPLPNMIPIKNHPNFKKVSNQVSTMRQQDSEEFLQHLIDRLRSEAKRQGRSEDTEPTKHLKFGMEQRLQCQECRRVGYRVDGVDLASLPVEAVEQGVNEDGKKLWKQVKLEECLDSFCATETLSDYSCSNCQKKVTAEK
jgi:ubiquitin carboxyl-terminal hydrolase 5/13